MWAEKVKQYFDAGVWNQKMVANAVIKGKITEDDYRAVTGAEYRPIL